jgi:hypothetical protein
LRYVNNFKGAKDPFAVLSINRPFENVSSQQTKFIQIREISEIEEKVFLGVNCQFVLPEESVILDLEAFCEGIDGEWNTDMFVEWAWKAHQLIGIVSLIWYLRTKWRLENELRFYPNLDNWLRRYLSFI